MLDEDDIFPFSQIRRRLWTREPTLHLGWDPPSPDQPVYVAYGDIGAFPAGPSGFLGNSFFYLYHLEVGVVRHVGEELQRSIKEVTDGEIRVITVKKKEKAKQETKEEDCARMNLI